MDVLDDGPDSLGSEGGVMGGGEADAMYDQAVAIVLQHKRASISLVQRHLRIGYNRAASLPRRSHRTSRLRRLCSPHCCSL